MKVLIAQINAIVGDLNGNIEKMIHCCNSAREQDADIVLFPELAVSGYPPEDLLLDPDFIKAQENCLEKLVASSEDLLLLVGVFRRNTNRVEKPLFNSCAIILDRKIMGYYDKRLLPTYDVFQEKRFFEPGSSISIIDFKGKKIAITICEDLWQHGLAIKETFYKNDPVQELAKNAFDLLVNLSASPYHFGKREEREKLFLEVAKKLRVPLIQCSQVGANDQLVFDGYSIVISARGEIIHRCKGFEEDLAVIDLEKCCSFLKVKSPIEDLYQALILGIQDYFKKQGFEKACLGVSGGIDSAVVACLAKEALGKDNVLGIALPSRFNSEQSLIDAKELCHNLGIAFKVIPIEKPFEAYLDTLSTVFTGMPQDVTEENLQARIRGALLMAISNKLGYMLLNTGNKSELALGYCTLYGDMCGALAVIGDVLKTKVYELAQFINQEKEIIPYSSINKAPSAELRPNQKDSDSLPEYSLIDELLSLYLEHALPLEEIEKQMSLSKVEIDDLIKRIHRAEYKRRQAPPVIRVSKKAFIMGRYYPIVNKWRC